MISLERGSVGIFGYLVPDSELHHMMATQSFDQTCGRPLRDNLARDQRWPAGRTAAPPHPYNAWSTKRFRRCVEIRE